MGNRVAVVTGGGAGMGFAIAQHLARRGDRVGIIDLNAEVAEQAAASIGAERTDGGGATGSSITISTV